MSQKYRMVVNSKQPVPPFLNAASNTVVLVDHCHVAAAFGLSNLLLQCGYAVYSFHGSIPHIVSLHSSDRKVHTWLCFQCKTEACLLDDETTFFFPLFGLLFLFLG